MAITPTYSGCPAMATMRDDLVRMLGEAGFADVRVRVALAPGLVDATGSPPAGRAALADHGISAAGPRPDRARARSPLPADADPPRACAAPGAAPTRSS